MQSLARGLAKAVLGGGLLACLVTRAAADLNVVVTIKPLHALVAQVMAGAGTPQLLVRGGSSAHTYTLKPSDAAKLNRADVVFRMSETMEPFTARIAKSLPGSVQVVTLQDTPGLTLLPRRTGAVFEKNGHDDEHDAGRREGDLEHGHGAIDGHAWIDPINARLMADRIALVLSAEEPARAALYRANADELKAKLDALGAELARELARAAGRPYVVFHDVLQYFERRYGLNVVGSIAAGPEMPPSAWRLTTLRKKVMALGAVCVFAETQFDARLVGNLVEGTRARTGTIDPEGSKLEPGPDLYFTLLRNLARDLKGCLASVG